MNAMEHVRRPTSLVAWISPMAVRLGWLGTGAALGAGLAMLLTPYAGHQLRRRLHLRTRRAEKYILARTHIEPK